MQKELDALVALYDVLEAGYRSGTVRTATSRSTMGRPAGGLRVPSESAGIRRDLNSSSAKFGETGTRPFGGVKEDVLEDEESPTPSGSVANE
jgi:hypothetical protein